VFLYKVGLVPVLRTASSGCVVSVYGWAVDSVSLALLGRSVYSNGVLVQNIAVPVA
jgi:hypothetical protein